MKNFAITLMATYLIMGCTEPKQIAVVESDPQILTELFDLSEDQNFFELKAAYDLHHSKLTNVHALFFKAIIANAFINPSKSNQAIQEVLTNEAITLPDSLLQKLYVTKMLNHTNLYEYELASQTSDLLLNNYSQKMDSTTVASFDNTNKIWSALKNTPKQQVSRNQDFTMPLVKDIAGLFNIDVTFADTTQHMIFDTGADFSVIRRSLVDQLGLTLIQSDFMVRTGTGSMVKSDLAVADQLDIGGMTFENVVFLVFNDELMSVPGYDFYGIIGFPVIEAMKEIHITSDKSLFVPKELTSYQFDNFALNGFKPVVSVKYKGDDLIFNFDTGANRTSLYPNFFNKYKKDIEANYSRASFSDGSVGGNVTFDGYKISGVELSIAGSVLALDSLQVHTTGTGQQQSKYYGNLGQDFIKQFDRMIISFEHTSIVFR
jgi:predicted aspartyl protease